MRWAAIEAVSRQRGGTFLQAHYHRIAERRTNRNIARVAAARRLLTLVFFGLRDGEIRCLAERPGEPARAQPGRALAICHDPREARSPS